MQALVVYESMFGNTRTVAEAIAEGLRGAASVELCEVAAAPKGIDQVDLVVVGAPTHAFGLSRPATRATAAEKTDGPLVSPVTGVREWLDELLVRPGTLAAAFDTRVDKPRVPGSAAAAARRRLRKLGFSVVAPPESFFVHDYTGPLLGGEAPRARAWGEELGRSVAATGATI